MSNIRFEWNDDESIDFYINGEHIASGPCKYKNIRNEVLFFRKIYDLGYEQGAQDTKKRALRAVNRIKGTAMSNDFVECK